MTASCMLETFGQGYGHSRYREVVDKTPVQQENNNNNKRQSILFSIKIIISFLVQKQPIMPSVQLTAYLSLKPHMTIMVTMAPSDHGGGATTAKNF